MNWDKYVFHLGNVFLNQLENSVHTANSLTLEKALLILLPLYVQMLKMLISTQAENHT